MRVRTVSRIGLGICFEFTDCISLEFGMFMPKDELIAEPWNWAGLTLFVGPIVLVGFEINASRMSVFALNAVVTLFWGC